MQFGCIRSQEGIRPNLTLIQPLRSQLCVTLQYCSHSRWHLPTSNDNDPLRIHCRCHLIGSGDKPRARIAIRLNDNRINVTMMSSYDRRAVIRNLAVCDVMIVVLIVVGVSIDIPRGDGISPKNLGMDCATQQNYCQFRRSYQGRLINPASPR